MAIQGQEPEEKQNNIADVDFNPLDAPVNEKRYAQAGAAGAPPESLTSPIDEPSFSPPPIGSKPNNNTGAGANASAKKPPREPFNPDMKQMPKKETEKAAEFAADLIMQCYEGIHNLANSQMQIPEKKLHKLQVDGEINLNAMIDYDYGKQISAGEFFKNYNTFASSVFVVSDDFKLKAMPLLKEILAERGIGATKEQALLFLVTQDLGAKVIQFIALKSQLNYMIESIKAATVKQYAPPPPRRDPPPPPQPKETTNNNNTPPPSGNASAADKKEGLKPDAIIMPKTVRGRPTRNK